MATLDLLLTLSQAGVDGLRETPKEIVGLCPNPNHSDTHPSWSINRTTYVHFCFSCGYKGTLTSLLVDLTGSAPPDLERDLRKGSFLREMERARQAPEETLEPVVPLLTEWSLANTLTDVPEKLLSFRRLRRAAIDRYQVRYQKESREWVLPIRSVAGILLGAQYRRVGSVMTRPTGLPKSTTLFGFHVARCYDIVVLVESPLDAVRLFGLGIPALASLGAWVSQDQVTLLARNFAAVCIALDDDKRGREGAEAVTNMLRRASCAAIPWRYEGLVDEDGRKAKDPGDVASDDALVDAWDRTRRFGL